VNSAQINLTMPVPLLDNLFDFAALTALVDDKRIAVVIAISVLSGIMRGFSGFGSALIYIPLISSIYDPKIAVATLLLIDFFSGIPFAVRALPQCQWHDIVPITISALAAIPFGTAILIYVVPVIMRWFIAVVALAILVIIASGWRYHNRPTLPLTICVGLLSGLLGGAVQMDGPPVVIYWLGSTSVAPIIRANLMVFIVLSGAATFISYLVSGLLTINVIALAVLLGIPFIISMQLGARLFHGTSDRMYRYITYGVIAISLIFSLPIFDGILR
jgi:uncharacterized protein